MLVSDYREALVEVLEILKHTSKSDRDKIPKKLILFFEKNASTTYKFTYDKNKEIKDLNLKPETKGLLAMIYRNYWCTPEKREEYDELLRHNQKLFDDLLREKYNPDKIFENNFYSNPFESNEQKEEESTISSDQEPTVENQSLVIYSQNIFSKILEKLQNFFNRFHFKSKSI